MLSKKMESALNGQLNAELFSSYLYVSMSAYFASVKAPGMERWMRAQAKEEEIHALKFLDFVIAQGGRVRLTAIAGPETEWASPLSAFEAAYAHEQKVTGMIGGLVKLAKEEGDEATGGFLQWFVKEQVEEEESADGVVQKLKKVKDDAPALGALDAELGKRGAA